MIQDQDTKEAVASQIVLIYKPIPCDPERLQSALERIYTRLIARGRENQSAE